MAELLSLKLGTVDYTLWRDGVLLGRVRMSFPVSNAHRHPGFSGMLEVEEAFKDIEQVMQSSMPLMPDVPTYQHIFRDNDHKPGPVAGGPLVSGGVPRAPKERIFSIRDAAGKALATQLLAIERRSPVHDEVTAVCRERGILPSPWVLNGLFVSP